MFKREGMYLNRVSVIKSVNEVNKRVVVVSVSLFNLGTKLSHF